MSTLKYTVIKSERQYKKYCSILENMVHSGEHAPKEEIELLTLLIEKWDDDHSRLPEKDPVELLKSLMTVNGLKARDLTSILQLSKGTVSKILNYQAGMSKETIRRLSEYFHVSHEAFNKLYPLKHTSDHHFSPSFNAQTSTISKR